MEALDLSYSLELIVLSLAEDTWVWLHSLNGSFSFVRSLLSDMGDFSLTQAI